MTVGLPTVIKNGGDIIRSRDPTPIPRLKAAVEGVAALADASS